MGTDMRPEKVILLSLSAFLALLALVYVSYIQQLSPLCRVLSGQTVHTDADSVVIVYFEPKKQEFAIRISDTDIEIDTKYNKKGDVFNKIILKERICVKNSLQNTKDEKKIAKTEKNNEKTSKNNEFCPFSAENIRNFLENWKNNPKNIYLASRLFSDSENDLNLVERISLMQAMLRGKNAKKGVSGENSLKTGKENIINRPYTVEIMNASENANAAVIAAAWLREKGFVPVIVPGMSAGHDKTEFFAYGSRNAAQKIKELLCGIKKEDNCRIIDFGAKDSVNAAIVLGRDFSKLFDYQKKVEKNKENIKKEDISSKNNKKTEKKAKNNAKNQQNNMEKQKNSVNVNVKK